MPVIAAIVSKDNPPYAYVAVNQGSFSLEIGDYSSPFPAVSERGVIQRTFPTVGVREDHIHENGFHGVYRWDGRDTAGNVEINTLSHPDQSRYEADDPYIRGREVFVYLRQPRAPRPLNSKLVEADVYQDLEFEESDIDLGLHTAVIIRRETPFSSRPDVLSGYRNSAFQVTVERIRGGQAQLLAEGKDAVGTIVVEFPDLTFEDTFVETGDAYDIPPRFELVAHRDGRFHVNWQCESQWGSVSFNDDEYRRDHNITGILQRGEYGLGRKIDPNRTRQEDVRGAQLPFDIHLKKGSISGSQLRVDLRGRNQDEFFQEP